MKKFLNYLRRAFILSLALGVLCCVVYPLIVTGVGKLLFKNQANGNLVEIDGKVVGSEYVGQEFTEDYYFKCRPSQYNYNCYTEDGYYVGKEKEEGNEYAGVSSGSANYAPSNEALSERVEADIEEFLEKNPDVSREDIPADLVTASGSGLDPHISPASAEVQIPAIAEASGLSEDELRQIVDDATEHKVLGVFGEEKVNVLKANIEIAQKMDLI